MQVSETMVSSGSTMNVAVAAIKYQIHIFFVKKPPILQWVAFYFGLKFAQLIGNQAIFLEDY